MRRILSSFTSRAFRTGDHPPSPPPASCVELIDFGVKVENKTVWKLEKEIANCKGGYSSCVEACAYECDEVRAKFRLKVLKKEVSCLVLCGKIDVSHCACDDCDCEAPDPNGSFPDCEPLKTEEKEKKKKDDDETEDEEKKKKKDDETEDEEKKKKDDETEDEEKKKKEKDDDDCKRIIIELTRGELCNGEVCNGELLRSGVLTLSEDKCVAFKSNIKLTAATMEYLKGGGKLLLRILYGKNVLCKEFCVVEFCDTCSTIQLCDDVFGERVLTECGVLYAEKTFGCETCAAPDENAGEGGGRQGGERQGGEQEGGGQGGRQGGERQGGGLQGEDKCECKQIVIESKGTAKNDCQEISLCATLKIKCVQLEDKLTADAVADVKGSWKVVLKGGPDNCVVQLPCCDSAEETIDFCLCVTEREVVQCTGCVQGQICYSISCDCGYKKEIESLKIVVSDDKCVLAEETIDVAGKYLGKGSTILCKLFKYSDLKFGASNLQVCAFAKWKRYIVVLGDTCETILADGCCEEKECITVVVPDCSKTKPACLHLKASLEDVCKCADAAGCKIIAKPSLDALFGDGITVCEEKEICFTVCLRAAGGKPVNNSRLTSNGLDNAKETGSDVETRALTSYTPVQHQSRPLFTGSCDESCCAIFRLCVVVDFGEHRGDVCKSRYITLKRYIPVVRDCCDCKTDNKPVPCNAATYSPGYWFSSKHLNLLELIFSDDSVTFGCITFTTPEKVKDVSIGGVCPVGPLDEPLVDPKKLHNSVRHAYTLYFNLLLSDLGDGCLGKLCFVDMDLYGDGSLSVLNGKTVAEVVEEIGKYLCGTIPSFFGLSCGDINAISQLVIDAFHEGKGSPAKQAFFGKCT